MNFSPIWIIQSEHNKQFGFVNLNTPYNMARSLFFSSDYKIRTPHIPPLVSRIQGKINSDYIIGIVIAQLRSQFVTSIVSLRTILTLILVFQVIVNCSRLVRVENLDFSTLSKIQIFNSGFQGPRLLQNELLMRLRHSKFKILSFKPIFHF